MQHSNMTTDNQVFDNVVSVITLTLGWTFMNIGDFISSKITIATDFLGVLYAEHIKMISGIFGIMLITTGIVNNVYSIYIKHKRVKKLKENENDKN